MADDSEDGFAREEDEKMANERKRLAIRSRLRGAAQRRIVAALPSAFRSHLKASIRETFLAFESLLDEAVKSLEQEGKKMAIKRTRKIKAG